MKTSRLCAASLIWLIASPPTLSAATEAPGTPTVEEGPTKAVTMLHLVRFTDGYLSVQVEAVSLHALLDEVARQSGLTVTGYVAPDEKVTLEFHQLPLREGLERILRHRSFVLQYAKGASGASRPKTLWLLSQGRAQSLAEDAVVDGKKTAFSADPVAAEISRLRARLDSTDPQGREEAAAALGETGHPKAVAPLTRALSDENPDVREAAIVSLAVLGGADAARALAVALNDADPGNREEAVYALLEIGDDMAVGLLEKALADDEAFVREAAAEALEELRDLPR